MGASRLPMRQTREILRLKYEGGLRHRAIARACGVGLGTVSEYVGRARRAGLAWPLPPELDDAALEIGRLGRAISLVNLEWRQPVVVAHSIGLSAVLFYDQGLLGKLTTPGDPRAFHDLGIGIRLTLGASTLLRVDYGHSLTDRNRAFSFGVSEVF